MRRSAFPAWRRRCCPPFPSLPPKMGEKSPLFPPLADAERSRVSYCRAGNGRLLGLGSNSSGRNRPTRTSPPPSSRVLTPYAFPAAPCIKKIAVSLGRLIGTASPHFSSRPTWFFRLVRLVLASFGDFNGGVRPAMRPFFFPLFRAAFLLGRSRRCPPPFPNSTTSDLLFFA